ncbi:MAG TPA: hypothetical protein VIV11_18515 [Kofleriaceae bacterium]
MTTTVQVLARFVDTLIDVAYVAPGGTYRFGDTCFAVDDLVERGATIGHVTIAASRVRPPRAGVPRREIEWRPYCYIGLSLAAHVGVWLAAILMTEPALAPATETSYGRATRIARFATPSQSVKHSRAAPPEEIPITADETPSESPLIAPEESPPGAVAGESAALLPEPSVDTGASDANQDGQQRRFDPTTNPAFDSVKTGDYSTVSTGRTAGQHYMAESSNGKRMPMTVVSCDSVSCIVIGGDNASAIRDVVQKRLPEILSCYEKSEGVGGKKVEVDFGIDAGGKVGELQVGGVGDVGTCVSAIIRDIEFAG